MQIFDSLVFIDISFILRLFGWSWLDRETLKQYEPVSKPDFVFGPVSRILLLRNSS